jgi:hypothetical protein
MQTLSNIFAEESPKVEKTDSLDSFRFIFTDGETVNNKARNIEQAAILAVSTRIRSGKHTNIMGVFAQNKGGKSEMVKITQVTIHLTPKM